MLNMDGLDRFRTALLACLVALVAVPHVVDAVAVMSVDLGSEWMKIAVVSVSRIFISGSVAISRIFEDFARSVQ